MCHSQCYLIMSRQTEHWLLVYKHEAKVVINMQYPNGNWLFQPICRRPRWWINFVHTTANCRSVMLLQEPDSNNPWHLQQPAIVKAVNFWCFFGMLMLVCRSWSVQQSEQTSRLNGTTDKNLQQFGRRQNQSVLQGRGQHWIGLAPLT